jgi:hypothetical protein
MKKVIMSAVLMYGTVTLALAQITIQQSHIQSVLAPGNGIVNRQDTTATMLNIGSPGVINAWNFSALATHLFQRFPSVALSSIPSSVRSNYPTATHAFAVDTTVQGISGTIYQFLQLDATGLRNLGATGVTGGIPALTISVTPAPEIVYGLPSTLGTGWVTAFTNTVRLLGSVLSTTTHNARYSVDAYGRMTMPGGQVHDALRIKKYNLYNGSPVLSYLFLARGGAQIYAESASPDTNINSGTIAIRRRTLVWNQTVLADPTDVRLDDRIPAAFALKQNYPNPFNPATRIEYELPTDAFVSLKVYNLIGQEVATLVNESKRAGIYVADWNAEGLPSGMYFYKIQAGAFNATRRMMLVR